MDNNNYTPPGIAMHDPHCTARMNGPCNCGLLDYAELEAERDEMAASWAAAEHELRQTKAERDAWRADAERLANALSRLSLLAESIRHAHPIWATETDNATAALNAHTEAMEARQ